MRRERSQLADQWLQQLRIVHPVLAKQAEENDELFKVIDVFV